LPAAVAVEANKDLVEVEEMGLCQHLLLVLDREETWGHHPMLAPPHHKIADLEVVVEEILM
jgi:hypothetical protein